MCVLLCWCIDVLHIPERALTSPWWLIDLSSVVKNRFVLSLNNMYPDPTPCRNAARLRVGSGLASRAILQLRLFRLRRRGARRLAVSRRLREGSPWFRTVHSDPRKGGRSRKKTTRSFDLCSLAPSDESQSSLIELYLYPGNTVNQRVSFSLVLVLILIG